MALIMTQWTPKLYETQVVNHWQEIIDTRYCRRSYFIIQGLRALPGHLMVLQSLHHSLIFACCLSIPSLPCSCICTCLWSSCHPGQDNIPIVLLDMFKLLALRVFLNFLLPSVWCQRTLRLPWKNYRVAQIELFINHLVRLLNWRCILGSLLCCLECNT
jgi:hypothetical protein